jgi:hypothetical protein
MGASPSMAGMVGKKTVIYVFTVDQQMLVIVLIWRVKKNRQIKTTPSFPFQCKTYDFTKFPNFERQIRQIKSRHIVKIANLIHVQTL